MLQINSGKLFVQGVGHSNLLRGVLFSNASIYGDGPVETIAGRLMPTDLLSQRPRQLVFEMTERIEAPAMQPGALLSHGIDSFLRDFGVVTSFALNVTCSPDVRLVERLIDGRRGMATDIAPGQLVKRVFDPEVHIQKEELDHLAALIKQLVGLRRVKFLSAMRAIRTYVTGLHRLADDHELAYTLLVASIESLAQDFEGSPPQWGEFDERKRRAIDAALIEASDEVGKRVREALLQIEHVGLGRKFRRFALSHIGPGYFREDVAGDLGAIGLDELDGALHQAYAIRSGHIHSLRKLPSILTMGGSFHEYARVDRATALTLQGLARLARHVITQFILQQPTVEEEPYNYQSEEAGVVMLELAPQHWVGNSDHIAPQHGRRRLEGFLSQIVESRAKGAAAPITDLRPMLDKVVPLLSTLTRTQRCPFVVLTLLFNHLTPQDVGTVDFDQVMRRYGTEIEGPSEEALVAHAALGGAPDWPLEEHLKVHDAYFKRRDRDGGLRVPRLLEAGITLTLAERYRSGGDLAAAGALVARAVANCPGHAGLLAFEKSYDEAAPIPWGELLFPARSETAKV